MVDSSQGGAEAVSSVYYLATILCHRLRGVLEHPKHAPLPPPPCKYAHVNCVDVQFALTFQN